MTGDKDIIDLTPYLEGSRPEEDHAFAVFGGGGAGSRFALPVWRAIYLLGGDRGGILALREGEVACDPVFVLDLKVDPARLAFPASPRDLMGAVRSGGRLVPAAADGDWAGVFLGEREGTSFFTVVAGMRDRSVLEDKAARQDFLFLSGECAGLVLHWRLDETDGSRD